MFLGHFPWIFLIVFFLTDEVFKDYIDGKLKHEDLKEKIETWTHQSLMSNFCHEIGVNLWFHWSPWMTMAMGPLGPELTLVWRADSKQLFWVALEFLDFFLPLSLHLYTSTPLHIIYVYTYRYTHIFNTHTHIYTYIYTHVYIYICIYVYMSTYDTCTLCPFHVFHPDFELTIPNWLL